MSSFCAAKTVAAAVLSITFSHAFPVAAQTPCPASGGQISGSCSNDSVQSYLNSSPTTVEGRYSNASSGKLTATTIKEGTALTVGEFDNSGSLTVNTLNSSGGTGISVGSDFASSDTLTITVSGGSGGTGVSVGGDFASSGTLTTLVSGGSGGTGISVGGDFANSGTAITTSSGGNGGSGISVDGGFDNSGRITATVSGGSDGAGISVGGDFANSGTVTATASSSAGTGISVGGGFDNSGSLTANAGGSGSGSGTSVSVGGDFISSGVLMATVSGSGSGGTGISVDGDFIISGTLMATVSGGSVGTGISVGSDFANSGTVNATTRNSTGTGIFVAGGFDNSGGLTAMADNGGTGISVGGDFANSGTVNATASKSAGIGLYVAGGFDNSGALTAIVSDGSVGTGISVGSDFANSGTVNATTSNSTGTGLYVAGGFDNSGALTATADNGGTGLWVGGDFANSGTVNATASNSAGIGLHVAGGFDNSRALTATADNDGTGLWVGGDFANSGTVNATASNSAGIGLYVAGGFDNSRALTATADSGGTGLWVGGDFANSGTVNATASNSAGTGLYVAGGFDNSRALTATADSGGTGLWVGGDFANSGTVNATASNSAGTGVFVAGGFDNRGVLTATADSGGTGTSVGENFTNRGRLELNASNDGTGLWVGGDFANSGTLSVMASAGGTGISIDSAGSFINSGRMNLISNGGHALYFYNSDDKATFAARSGSSLVVAGFDPTIVFNDASGFSGTLAIESGVGLSLLGANEFGEGSQTFVLARNVENTLGAIFDLHDSAVFSYSQYWRPTGAGSGSGGDYEVVVTRLVWASDLTGGQGGTFVSGLETYFLTSGTGPDSNTSDARRMDENVLTNGTDPTIGSSAQSWLELLHDINSASTTADVRQLGQNAARLNTAQATGQSLFLIQDASRRMNSAFYEELGAQQRGGFSGLVGNHDPAPSIWISPVYLSATQDGSERSLSSVDGDWWGFSLGGSLAPRDYLRFGLGFHYLSGDFDAGREYDGNSTAWGVVLGFAANLGDSRKAPLLSGAISHTRHDFDQTRRDEGQRYLSSPDIAVTTVALDMSQDFYPSDDGSFVLRPRFGVDWSRTRLDGYDERGSGPRALRVGSENFDSFRSRLGTAVLWKLRADLNMELGADWLHEFADRSPLLSSVARDLPGLSLYTPRSDNRRDAANLRASVAFDAGAGVSFSLDYDGLFNDNLSSHQLSASLKYTF